eukprot:TRINITY_DN30959_c0_g1_i2.p1 TRINITY_DN30959_c0_g1~~TRINITY_DN30959_c0_g1_i2.p1  ORF type:complete len:287 (+),score=68.58 TRINITY_DN30959_c0_g1_i2:127-987(+)
MIRRPPRSTLSSSSAASDVYKRQAPERAAGVNLLARAVRDGAVVQLVPDHLAPNPVPGMREQLTAEKGYLLLQQLQSSCGCTQFGFDTALFDFCERFKFQSVTTNDLFAFLFDKFPVLTEPELGINFRRWLIGPGLEELRLPAKEPWEVTMTALARAWSGQGDLGVLAQAVRRAPELVARWTRWDMIAFLDSLLDKAPLPAGAVDAIDNAYHFSMSNDWDVVVRWLQVVSKEQGRESSELREKAQELIQRTGVATVHMAIAKAVGFGSIGESPLVHPNVKSALQHR